jgi:hypothetical protein
MSSFFVYEYLVNSKKIVHLFCVSSLVISFYYFIPFCDFFQVFFFYPIFHLLLKSFILFSIIIFTLFRVLFMFFLSIPFFRNTSIDPTVFLLFIVFFIFSSTSPDFSMFSPLLTFSFTHFLVGAK